MEIGGHNIIEPARLGAAVLTGPYTKEIAEQIQILQAAGGMMEVTDTASLAVALQLWLDDPVAGLEVGAKGLLAFDGLEALPGRLAELILEHSL